MSRALALEPDRNGSGAGLEPDLLELQRLPEDERRAERRMPGERQLRRRREDADPRMAVRLRRQDEDRLGVVHLARQRLHQLVVDLAPIGEHGELVAGQRRVGEDVDDDVAKRQRHELHPATP